jgi:hypothetical protein
MTLLCLCFIVIAKVVICSVLVFFSVQHLTLKSMRYVFGTKYDAVAEPRCVQLARLTAVLLCYLHVILCCKSY